LCIVDKVSIEVRYSLIDIDGRDVTIAKVGNEIATSTSSSIIEGERSHSPTLSCTCLLLILLTNEARNEARCLLCIIPWCHICKDLLIIVDAWLNRRYRSLAPSNPGKEGRYIGISCSPIFYDHACIGERLFAIDSLIDTLWIGIDPCIPLRCWKRLQDTHFHLINPMHVGTYVLESNIKK
jgi:hypothetical protein